MTPSLQEKTTKPAQKASIEVREKSPLKSKRALYPGLKTAEAYGPHGKRTGARYADQNGYGRLPSWMVTHFTSVIFFDGPAAAFADPCLSLFTPPKGTLASSCTLLAHSDAPCRPPIPAQISSRAACCLVRTADGKAVGGTVGQSKRCDPGRSLCSPRPLARTVRRGNAAISGVTSATTVG